MVLPKIERSHLNDGIVLGIFHAHFRASHHVIGLFEEEGLFVEAGDYQVKDRNDVCGVVQQLSVEGLVEFKYVVAVHIQDVHLRLVDLVQLRDVERLLAVVLVVLSHLHEGREEGPQFLLHLRRVNVCAVEHLSVAGCFLHVQALHPSGRSHIRL